MEIIPRPKRKILHFETILFYFSTIIFILVITASLYFWFQERLKKREISQIENKISALKTPEIKKSEDEVLKYKQKISDFSKLIEGHLFYSKIFPFLEQRTHKQIYFSKMDLDFENGIISLSGEAPNFPILSQQLEILKSDKSLISKLKDINLGRDGKVSFLIQISFSKNILK
jgi:cell division protein FtsL